MSSAASVAAANAASDAAANAVNAVIGKGEKEPGRASDTMKIGGFEYFVVDDEWYYPCVPAELDEVESESYLLAAEEAFRTFRAKLDEVELSVERIAGNVMTGETVQPTGASTDKGSLEAVVEKLAGLDREAYDLSVMTSDALKATLALQQTPGC